MSGLVELYCSVDDFWKFFKTEWDKHLIDRRWPHGPRTPAKSPHKPLISARVRLGLLSFRRL